MMSVASQKRRPFNADLNRENAQKSSAAKLGEYEGCFQTVLCSNNP